VSQLCEGVCLSARLGVTYGDADEQFVRFPLSIRKGFVVAAGHQATAAIKGAPGVGEVHRHIEPLGGGPELIDSEVQMRLAQSIAGIAAGGDPLARLHAVSLAYDHAALREVPIEGDRAISVLDKNMIVVAWRLAE
jgi:hypothetical protein